MKLDTRNIYAERMLRVLNHVQGHLDGALDLNELASLAHFSVSHFHRVFKGMIGETIMDHVRRIRMERAFIALSGGSEPVTEIAFDAGYEALEAFSRAFRKSYGLSPTQCRENGCHRQFNLVPSGVHFGTGEIVEILFDNTGVACMNVRIETLPERRIALVRQTGPYQESSPRAWGMLCSWAGPQGLIRPTSLLLGIGHDDPTITAPEEIRYDAAVVLEEEVNVTAPVTLGTLQGGDYAIITHQGPYEKLEESYKAIMGKWIPSSGREMRDCPVFEVYLNNPETTPADQLLTDIYIPLK